MATKYKHGKLKPEFKAKWLAALRSGEYGQGKSALNPGPGKYCCLGVACVVNGNTLTKPNLLQLNTTIKLGLPRTEDAREWWGTFPVPKSDIDSPRVKVGRRWYSLTTLNDEHNYTFDKIADLIEEQL